MRRTTGRARAAATVIVLALLIAACGGDDGDETGGADGAARDADGGAGAEDDQLQIAVASFDLAAGEDQRLLAGLLSSQRELLAFGEVTFQLGFLGDEPSGEVDLTQTVDASFLPVPGMEPEGDSDAPTFLEGQTGSGVYTASVDFDQAGFWGLRVAAETAEGRILEGSTTFAVQEEHLVTDVGDPAPASENFTVEDVQAGDVEPVAVDSRAGGDDAEIPDQHLHDEVIADLLEAGRPMVVGVMTPVYCVSRFCGPLSNELADLAEDYEDTASFVHLEVWKDFEEQQVNDAAAEWVLPGGDAQGNEPWVFLVDGSGTVTHRWDNVLDVDELTEALDEL